MPYAVENALYQWGEGESRVGQAPHPERAGLEAATEVVLEELRRRLGSRFVLDELAGYYAQGTDWAEQLAARYAGGDAAAVVDAAFARYAREARNYAGGATRPRNPRPDE